MWVAVANASRSQITIVIIDPCDSTQRVKDRIAASEHQGHGSEHDIKEGERVGGDTPTAEARRPGNESKT